MIKNSKYAEAGNGMVSSAFPDATKAGVYILKKGGNAVDAACTAAFALGVCEPQASGLGGQTMMLIGSGKKVIAVDGSSRAPSLAHASAIYKTDRSVGYRASTVPSTLATLWYVHSRYGSLPWSDIIKPAIRIASEGYKITKLQQNLQENEAEKFKRIHSESGIRYFFNKGRPYKEGELFRQPDLANLLEIISDKGIEDFYTGKIAKQIDADMRENGGLLRYDDLALIPLPIERKPLRQTFRKYVCYTMPPPGSGRTLLFALMMINTVPAKLMIKNEFRRIHLLCEIFRKALLERSDRPFDANFFPQVPEKDMLNRDYARKCIAEIVQNVDKKILSSLITEDERTGETTHLSVIDKSGLAVSLTQSIERVYGSKAVAAGLGFLYNNYLQDFEYKHVEHPFYLRPNAVPWATVSPTLIYDNKDIWMVVGSPGSERIISSIAQFLLGVIDKKQSMYDAMEAPRVHCSLGGRVSLEAERFDTELVEFLLDKGYRIDKREPYAFYLGAIHAVLRSSDNKFQGVAEIRRDGTAGGY